MFVAGKFILGLLVLNYFIAPIICAPRSNRIGNKALNRSTRSLPALKAALGKYIGLGTTMIVSGAAMSGADVLIRRASDNAERERLIVRRRIACKDNNYGCLHGRCWSNCGPRLETADWCFTTKAVDADANITYVECKRNADCDPCWNCAAVCVLQHGDEFGNK